MSDTRLPGTQLGFTIVELLVTIAIIALLSLAAVPFARDIIVSGKVEPTASDINKVATRLRGNFAGQGSTPYVNLGTGAAATAVFANTARSLASSLIVTGMQGSATVQHEIGETGAQVTVAQGQVSAPGDAFVVTLPRVSAAACPALAAQLSRAAERIAINNTEVKPIGGSLNGGAAQNACTPGDTNTFSFLFR
jgi:type IV pilus assembly protein PilA